MIDWPPIDDPALRERLALDEDGFLAHMARFWEDVGRLPWEDGTLTRAYGYPWRRPERSFLLRADGSVCQEVGGLALESLTAGRRPLLAIGSNGAPGRLRVKFGHFEDPADREVLVLAGHLQDFDVGAATQPTVYGSMPATLFASPGTAVRTALLWLTPAQFTQIVWTEVSYRLGHLAARFTALEPGHEVDGVLAFASRFPLYAEDGRVVALAAIPARERTAPARTQEELLGGAARVLLGRGARAEDLVRAIHDDPAEVLPRARRLDALGVPFGSDRWTPYPAGGPR